MEHKEGHDVLSEESEFGCLFFTRGSDVSNPTGEPWSEPFPKRLRVDTEPNEPGLFPHDNIQPAFVDTAAVAVVYSPYHSDYDQQFYADGVETTLLPHNDQNDAQQPIEFENPVQSSIPCTDPLTSNKADLHEPANIQNLSEYMDKDIFPDGRRIASANHAYGFSAIPSPPSFAPSAAPMTNPLSFGTFQVVYHNPILVHFPSGRTTIGLKTDTDIKRLKKARIETKLPTRPDIEVRFNSKSTSYLCQIRVGLLVSFCGASYPVFSDVFPPEKPVSVISHARIENKELVVCIKPDTNVFRMWDETTRTVHPFRHTSLHHLEQAQQRHGLPRSEIPIQKMCEVYTRLLIKLEAAGFAERFAVVPVDVMILSHNRQVEERGLSLENAQQQISTTLDFSERIPWTHHPSV